MSAAKPVAIPEKYDVEISVSPYGQCGTKMSAKFPGIRRADILADDYREKGVQMLIRQFENLVYGK